MAMARTYNDAASRWAGIGPYYAMFPVEFANEVIAKHTHPGDMVLDPFAGRGTAIFSAATLNRSAVGIEISPVGYVYSKAKLSPASREDVELRLDDINEYSSQFKEAAKLLPEFYHRCFSEHVCSFLLAARAHLNWHHINVDYTLMALLLVYLHGKMGAALSNQMRQTKSMSPQYAVRWWDERQLDPPDIDPVAFIKSRLIWRYAKGTPEVGLARMYLGNSIEHLEKLNQQVEEGLLAKGKLLFTSPPYHAVTNYHYDQWLRLWLLGGPPNALRNGNGRSGKFVAREAYRQLLTMVFTRAAKVLDDDATVYVRTDIREFTYCTTKEVLRNAFPGKRLTEISRPMLRPSQTRLFGKGGTTTKENGEIDLVLLPR